MTNETTAPAAEAPDVRPEPSESAEAARSAFAVHRDPSLPAAGTDRASRVGRGIAWVRPTDLIASSTARLAGRGITLQSELSRRTRTVPGAAYRATRDRGRELHAHRTGQRVREESAVFESFDVLESPERARSSSWVRSSGIGLG